MKYRITVIGASMDRQTIYFAPHFTPLGNGSIRVTSAFRANPGAGVEKVDMLFIIGPIIEVVEITDGEYKKITGSES